MTTSTAAQTASQQASAINGLVTAYGSDHQCQGCQ